MNAMKRLFYIVLLILLPCADGWSQAWVVKSNLLYDLTSSLNLGTEVALGRKWSLDVSGNYNPWKFGDKARWKHWGVQPEVRYWLCEKFNGHFVGLHGHYVAYNVGGMSFLSDNMEQYRYEGDLFGAGLSYGYQWLLHPRWSLEMVLGAGYARLNQDKYVCESCGEWVGKADRNYFGVTKVAVSLIYVIK